MEEENRSSEVDEVQVVAKPGKPWQFDLAQYIKEGEPAQAEKSRAWETAIGLQAVDGLETSTYLLETAKDNIEGRIGIKAVQKRIELYYEERKSRNIVEEPTEEADLVSARIAQVLQESAFQFSPVYLKKIHGALFKGLVEPAGDYRSYNITKKEWVLAGDTVYYASADSIAATLTYDFNQEKAFSYKGISQLEAVRHIAAFCSGIWQIHPFCEGNTRTTAVFMIKYLKTLGFEVDNALFAENSWYFRNALVRSNFNDIQKGVHATNDFLDAFFENLLMGAGHELKNRYMHVEFDALSKGEVQNITKVAPKYHGDTLDDTLGDTDELLLHTLVQNPLATQVEIAGQLQVSVPTVKRHMQKLQERGLIAREGGKRFGKWIVLSKNAGDCHE